MADEELPSWVYERYIVQEIRAWEIHCKQCGTVIIIGMGGEASERQLGEHAAAHAPRPT